MFRALFTILRHRATTPRPRRAIAPDLTGAARRAAVLAALLTPAIGAITPSGAQPTPAETVPGMLPQLASRAAAAGPDLMLQFRDLDRQLASPAGVQILAMLDELGLFRRTAESARGLTAALGVDADQTIPALLGGRVLILADGLADVDPARWACVLSLDPAVGAGLPRALKAAPRSSLSGRTVYAIEDGRLALLPLDDAGTRLAVSVRGAEDLLALAADLARDWEGPGKAGPEAAPSGLAVYRQSDGSLLSGTIALADELGWDIAFSVVGQPADDSPASSALLTNAWDTAARIHPDWYDRVTRDAPIAFAGPVDPAPVLPSVRMGIVDLNAETLRKWAAIFMPFQPPPEILREEADFALLVANPEHAGSAWLRVADARAAASTGDAYVCEHIAALAGSPVLAADAPECTGRFPGAGRRVALPAAPVVGSAGAAPAQAAPLAYAWGLTNISLGGLPGESWWSMHAVRTGDRPPSLAPGLSGDPEAPLLRLTIRPDALVRTLAGEGGPGEALLAAASPVTDRGTRGGLARIGLIDLSLTPSEAPSGPANGRLRLRFAEPAQR